ncbi:MAG: DUF4326 domain-containing protein [Pseudooceanicola sp.]|nr:DUF4326 domain-containing protein [Pseudooceanicola sp.]
MTRHKPWRQDNPDAVIVDRTTMWGNPWRAGDDGVPDSAEAVRLFRAAVTGFDSGGSWCAPQAHPESYIGKIISGAIALRGKDLACWCPPDQPCHADVLLELANRD